MRPRAPFVVAVSISLLAAACSSSDTESTDTGQHLGSTDAGKDGATALDAGEGDGDVTSDAGSFSDAGDAPWTSVSFGVTQKEVGGGDNVAIAYGGYTATDAESQAWVSALEDAELASLGVGRLFAVRGPKDADYHSREIGNSTLAAKLATMTSATEIIVVAHSSGGFVADELLSFASADVLAKVVYFNLDGGSWWLSSARVATMGGVYVVGAHDPAAGSSENYGSDQSLHSALAGSQLFTVDATGSGCNSGAGWCLHDTVITNEPHNPAFYDLADDYTDFTGTRHVVTSYLEQAVSDGRL